MIKRKIQLMALIMMTACTLGGCTKEQTRFDTEPVAEGESPEGVDANDQGVVIIDTPDDIPTFEQKPIVTMDIQDYGTIVIELYPDKAPNTVNNFVSLVQEGFYDGLTFHRIIEGFMIQGGDPSGDGTGNPGYSIAGEFADNGYEVNDLVHTKGVISMARSMAPDSAGSQFFIMSSDSPHLDGQYAAFGRVISGLEIVETLEKVDTDGRDMPVEPVIIQSMIVDTNGEEIPPVIKQ